MTPDHGLPLAAGAASGTQSCAASAVWMCDAALVQRDLPEEVRNQITLLRDDAAKLKKLAEKVKRRVEATRILLTPVCQNLGTSPQVSRKSNTYLHCVGSEKCGCATETKEG